MSEIPRGDYCKNINKGIKAFFNKLKFSNPYIFAT